jgi:hypothetical protein
MSAFVEQKVVSARSTGTTAGTTTVATVGKVQGKGLDVIAWLRVRLNVTTAPVGTAGQPTVDVYLERKVGADPDWEDFYHFPQVGASLIDRVVNLPLPGPQDVDGSLGSASRTVAVETLAADTLLAGPWGDQIRIREVLADGGASSIDTAAVYDVEMVGA